MICKAFRSQMPPENIGKFIKMNREQRIPAMSKMEGYRGGYLFTKQNGEFMEITFWEKEEQPRAWWDSSAFNKFWEQTKPLFAGNPFITVIQDVFEVQDIGSLEI